jgi:ribokinase
VRTIACAGAIVQDVYLRTELAPKGGIVTAGAVEYALGGAPGNVSRCLARLGVAAEAVACVGDDGPGRWLRGTLDSMGVGTSRLSTVADSPTGVSAILVTPDGDRTIYCYPGANDRFDGHQITGDEGWSVCHLGYPPLLPRCQGEALARLFRRLQGRGVMTSLDTVVSSAAQPLEEIAPALRYTDVFTPNLEEASQLTGLDAGPDALASADAAAGRLLSYGVGLVAITLDAQGAYVATSDAVADGPTRRRRPWPSGLRRAIPGYDVQGTLNTTAAGDSFTAGLLASLLRSLTPEHAARAGNLAAALSVEGSPLPPLDDLLDLVQRRPTR